MRKVIANNRRRSKRGTTLVELIVSLTLTAMFAVICVMLINPIERTYQRTEKTARAQLLADTIVDSIRKECDGIKNDDINSVWIANGSFDADTASDKILFDPVCSKRITSGLESNNNGTVLVIKKNNSYCEMIFASLPITSENKTEANKNVLDGTYSGHAVDELFQGSAEDVAKNTGRGVVHFGYYGAGDKGNGVYPLKAYDYTNPLIASTYGDYHVKVYFQKLVTRTEEIDGVDHEFPSYVECEVKVYEGEYKAGDNTSALVYTRKAAISFSANGSRPGTSYVDPHHSTTEKKKNVKVTVVWDDNNNSSGMRPANVTVKLMNGTQVLAKRVVPANRNPYTFTFVNVKDVDVTVEQEPMAVDGYKMREIKKVNGGFIITNKANSIKLISGPSFNDVLKNKVKYVTSVIFGSESELKQYIPNFETTTKFYKVSQNEKGQITDDYKLYYVNKGTNNNVAYVVSKDGNFLANEDCSQMFANCGFLENVTDIGRLETSSTYTMEQMFKNCTKMVQFDMTGLIDEGSVAVSAESMFEGCTKAEKCIFTSCDTGRISSMKRMFYNYSTSSAHTDDVIIDLSDFKFTNCTDMTEMFANNASSKTIIDEIIFPEGTVNMPKVTSMKNMFNRASGVLKISNFNELKCPELLTVECMFDYCGKVKELDLHDFYMPKCNLVIKWGTNNKSAFRGCSSLEEINLNGWEVHTEAYLRDYFSNNENLKRVYLNDTKFTNLTSIEGLFYLAHALEEVEMRGLVDDKCRSLRSLFNECYNLNKINMSEWDTKNVDTMRDMFKKANTQAAALDVDLSKFRFDSCTDFYRMFEESGVHSVTFPSSSPSNPIIIGESWQDEDDTRDEKTPSHYSFSFVFNKCERLTKVNNFNVSFGAGLTVSNMFHGCKLLGSESGGKVKFYISVPKATSMSNMFDGCSSITELDLSGSSFVSVTNASSAMSNCSKMTKLTMEDVNLASANNVGSFFNGTNVIEVLDWDGINLSSVTDLSITNKGTVKEIYLRGATLTGLTKIEQLFQNRTKLITVHFSDVTLPSGLDSAYQMFKGCGNLTTVTLDGFKAPRSVREMFLECYKLESINLGEMDTSNTEVMDGMFKKCTALKNVSLDGINTSKVKTMDAMFNGCTLLESVIFSSDPSNQCGPSESAAQIFSGCIYIKAVTGFKAPSNCSEMFKDCYYTEGIVLANWNTEAVTNMSGMFNGCNNIKTIDLSSFKTSNVINMKAMFQNCYYLSFDSSTWKKWDTSNVTDMSSMFYRCCYNNANTAGLTADKIINIESFDFRNVTTFENMFACETGAVSTSKDLLSKIVFPKGKKAKAMNATTCKGMFKGRLKLTDFANFGWFTIDSSKITALGDMFYQIGARTLDLRSFDFGGITSNEVILNMFKNAADLQTIYVAENTDASHLGNRFMFVGCKKLEGGAGTKFATEPSGNNANSYAKYAVVDGYNGHKGYFTYDPTLAPLEET